MTTAKLLALTAITLLVTAGIGLTASWTAGLGSVLLLAAATTAAMAWEARDYARHGFESLADTRPPV